MGKGGGSTDGRANERLAGRQPQGQQRLVQMRQSISQQRAPALRLLIVGRAAQGAKRQHGRLVLLQGLPSRWRAIPLQGIPIQGNAVNERVSGGLGGGVRVIPVEE